MCNDLLKQKCKLKTERYKFLHQASNIEEENSSPVDL
ncbi:hypothetical protein ABIB40_003109 [Pedobacter sp. UYP30]